MSIDDRDYAFLSEALPQLQEYLLSNELFWPLNATMPRLTPGSMLLALTRLQVGQPAQAQKLRQQFEETRGKWRVAWDKKAAREISNRLRLWSNFIADYEKAPAHAAGDYPAQVRGRVILQLLTLETPDFSEKSALAYLDARFKARTSLADFLWDANLQAIFPKADYWFLYEKL
jgi:hypothetical protein